MYLQCSSPDTLAHGAPAGMWVKQSAMSWATLWGCLMTARLEGPPTMLVKAPGGLKVSSTQRLLTES
jgi:hypothetical protein